MRMTILATLAAFVAAPAFADEVWTLNSEESSIRYISMKNGEIAETNIFTGLSGQVSDGAATIAIDLTTVDTGIDIRNERMRKHVYGEDGEAIITADIDMDVLEGLDVGAFETIEADLMVAVNGDAIDFYADLTVARLDEDTVLVVNPSPLLVHADDFGFADGIATLKQLAGLDSIQLAVPVTVELAFER